MMPAVPRHAKHKAPVTRLGAVAMAAAALAGVAAAFVFLPGNSAAARPQHDAAPVTNAASDLTRYQMTTSVHRAVASLETRTARRKHLAAVAAARLAQRRAARQQARQAQQAATPSPPPSPAPARRRPRHRRRPRRRPPAAGMPPIQRSGPASATPKRAAATPGDQVTAAVPTSSRSAPGKPTAARPASSAWPALLTRIRYSTTPSRPAVRPTGRTTTDAEPGR